MMKHRSSHKTKLIVAQWCQTASKILVNTGFGNGLLFDGTKPYPEPVLPNHLVAFTWG